MRQSVIESGRLQHQVIRSLHQKSPVYSVEVYILTWKTMLSVLENDIFCAGKRYFLCWKTMFSVLENDVVQCPNSTTERDIREYGREIAWHRADKICEICSICGRKGGSDRSICHSATHLQHFYSSVLQQVRCISGRVANKNAKIFFL